MSYVPNNAAIFNAAIAAIAGFDDGGGLQAPDAFAAYAEAWAEAVDTVWGPGSYSALDVADLQVASAQRWAKQGPPTWRGSPTVAASYLTAAAQVVALVRAGTAAVVAQGINPNAGVPSGVIVKLEQDLPLVALQTGGASTSASFDVGGALPANARVFPSTAEVEIVAPLTADAPVGGIDLTVTGGNQQTGGGPHIAPTAPNTAGIAGNELGLGWLCADQGGQQILFNATIGTNWNLLTGGHIKVRILYTVLP